MKYLWHPWCPPQVGNHRKYSCLFDDSEWLNDLCILLYLQMMLFTYLRLAKLFGDFSSRLYCVWARLQALSILVYSNASQVITHIRTSPDVLYR